MALSTILFVLSLSSSSYTANILAIIPTPSYSHQTAFTALWRELSLRGHGVTLVTTDPVNDPKLTNLTEIDIRWAYKYFANMTQIANSGSMTMWDTLKTFAELTSPMVEEQLAYAPIQDLIQNRRKFDVVLMEHLYPVYLGFAEIYHCPKILVGSLETWPNIHNYMGNQNHPTLNPDLGSPFYGQLSFKERLISTLYNYHVSYYFNSLIPDNEKLMHKYFNITVPLVSLLTDIDLLVLNVNPVIQGVRAIGPTTINIGGFRPKLDATPLPKDLQEFLDSAKNGFIYFSLGSNVKSNELGKETLNSIISTFSELPYKVLWKFEDDTLSGKPNNVKLVKWSPQQQVLAHPNIKLFVTQGGLQSMEEGIYAEVPFVVIPHFGDQFQNANIMITKGIAKLVGKDPFIKKEDLKSAILDVIRNPSYKTAVQNLKRVTLDTPMTGLEKAVWWTEYVIRNKGTKHLRNPAADIPSYQYYLLDVIGFLVLVTVLIMCVIVLVLKVSFKWLNQYIRNRSGKLKNQ